MNEEQARQFIRALFHYVWEKRDKSRIPEFYAANLTGFIDQLPVGIRDIYAGVDFISRNLSSNVYSIHDLIISGNKIAAVVNVKSVTADEEVERYTSNAFFFEMHKGKIAKMRMYIGEAHLTALQEEESSEEGSGSFLSKAVDAVSKLSKSKKANHKKAEDDVEPPPPPPPKKPVKQKAKPAQEASEKVPPKKQPVKKEKVTKKPEAESSSDYSASPAPKFSFNKAKLQVGVTPKDNKSDKS